ncbi:MAG: hypothetical protein AB9903_15650 [Vulcanimicrobiota bacterium]
MSKPVTLPDIDQYTTGPLCEPYDDNMTIDYQGFRKYVQEKYNGDSSKMTQEENDMFIKQARKRRTA